MYVNVVVNKIGNNKIISLIIITVLLLPFCINNEQFYIAEIQYRNYKLCADPEEKLHWSERLQLA